MLIFLFLCKTLCIFTMNEEHKLYRFSIGHFKTVFCLYIFYRFSFSSLQNLPISLASVSLNLLPYVYISICLLSVSTARLPQQRLQRQGTIACEWRVLSWGSLGHIFTCSSNKLILHLKKITAILKYSW